MSVLPLTGYETVSVSAASLRSHSPFERLHLPIKLSEAHVDSRT